jgi:hypothetical protein
MAISRARCSGALPCSGLVIAALFAAVAIQSAAAQRDAVRTSCIDTEPNPATTPSPATPRPGHSAGLTSQGYGMWLDVDADASEVTTIGISRLDDCTPQGTFVDTDLGRYPITSLPRAPPG